MRVVLDLDQHRAEYDAVLGRELRAADVRAGAAARLAAIGIQATAVLAADGQAHDEGLSFDLAPVDLHAAVLVSGEGQEIGAVVAVDRDAATLGDVADDGIAGHGLAALGITYHQPFDAVNLDAATQAQPLDDPAKRRRLGRLLILRREIGIQRFQHLAELDVAAPDGRLHLVSHAERERGRRLGQLVRGRRVEAPAANFAREDLAPERHAPFMLFLLDPLADFLARPAGLDVGQPVPRRLGLRAREHLDRVAVAERPVQRRDPSVHARAVAMLPHFGVHHEREIDRRCTFGQALDVPLGRKDEDLVLVEIDLQELEEFLRAMRVLLQLDQLPEPRQVMIELVGGLAVFLVEPMRGDTIFRRAMHIARADLDFVQLPTRTKDGGVERLVAVRLGARDVVLDALLERRPGVVDDAEHVVAVGDRVHQHADREQIVNLLERLAALLHLLEDRPEVLGPSHDLPPGDPGPAQFLGERRAHALDRAITLYAARLHLSRQLLVVIRLEVLERQILELGLDPRHAEAVCQRRVQLPGLERDAAALLGRQRVQRPHVVEPLGELDDDDPGVARDRHQQLAIVLGLFFGGRTEVQRGDLREAVDKIGDFVAEVPPQHVQGDVGVLDDVVQQRRRDRRRIHLLLSQNRRDGHAMRHEIVPGQTLLSLLRLRADPVGTRQDVEIEAVVLRRHGPRALRRETGPCPGAGCCAGGFRPRARRARHNSPASAKLTYRSPPPPPITTWSYTGTSSRPPASTSCRVTVRSSAEGVGSPLGWLCTTMIPAAASAIAARNTSRGCTSELFKMPRVMSRSARIWLWLPNART